LQPPEAPVEEDDAFKPSPEWKKAPVTVALLHEQLDVKQSVKTAQLYAKLPTDTAHMQTDTAQMQPCRRSSGTTRTSR